MTEPEIEPETEPDLSPRIYVAVAVFAVLLILGCYVFTVLYQIPLPEAG